MELIKSAAKRSRVSDLVYIVLNVLFAGLVLGLTLAFTPPYVAYLLVILSKWRVFAVKPRFWLANLQTNMVDLFVGLSIVTMLWQASGALMVQLLLSALFVAWLLVIKPRSKRVFILAQACISQFFSMIALFSVAHNVDVSIVVVSCWVIGYVSARHVLESYDDQHVTFLAMVWAFVVAEMGWLGYHWTIGYELSGQLRVPQIAILVTLFGYVCSIGYDAYHHGRLSKKTVRNQVIFAIVVGVILLIGELRAIIGLSA